MWLPSRRVILTVAIFLHVCPRSLTDAVQIRGSDKNSADGVCSHDTFHCHNETELGNHCIPQSWVCDGDEDCANGEDEKADCDKCPNGLFKCASGRPYCISQGFVCDNEEDCSDGSDEAPKECLGRKSGTHTRGQEVDTSLHCLPSEYQCPNTQHCIDIEKVCDSYIDCDENGADEGHHCANYGCKQKSCEFKCRETIKGPLCYCQKGYEANGTKCQDFNECDFKGYDEFCDQMCQNTIGHYTCSCAEGYIKGSGGNLGRCIAENSSQAALLVTNYMNLLFLDLSKHKSMPKFNVTGDRITSVDFHIQNNSACWISYNQEKGQTELQCSSLEDSTKRWIVKTHFKLSSVHQIAVDWISGNFYFVDDKRDRIFLCTSDGQHCLTVIYHGISRPKSIAIDASRGLIFYGDWSSKPKLGRANLDGSAATTIATIKIIHPSAITLDYANKHVYWADSFLNLISQADYDGRNRKTVFENTDIKPHYGLTLFENYLYVSNLKLRNHSVMRLHRYDKRVKPQFIKKDLIKPGALQVVHPVRQPGYQSELCRAANCSHICIPVPNGNGSVTATCTCRAGFSLTGKTQCEKKIPDQFLIYANAQQGTVRGISLNPNITNDVMEPIQNLNKPIALAYHAETDIVYFSDVSMLRIGQRNVNSEEEATVFLDSGVTSCEGLAVDWVGKNLYWTDDGHQTINVVRLDNNSIVYTIINNTNHPRSIVIDPNEGYMYWIDLLWRPPQEITAKIEKAAMDGSNRTDLVVDNIKWPNSLTLDTVNHRLYWTDAHSDTIESIKTDGTARRIERHLQGDDHRHPYGVALHDGNLYWTESLKGFVDTFSPVLNKTIHLHTDSTPLFDLILFDKKSQTVKSGHPCSANNGNCSDLCLSLPKGRTCACANGRRLKDDSQTCEDIPNYVHPPVCDKNFKFQCANGECINIRFKCDGDFDCEDKSDEDNSEHGACSNVTCPDESMFSCGNQRCIYAQFVCDGEADCIDETDEHAFHCNSERKCPANYTMCNNTYRCIPESWRCDHDKDCADGSDEDDSCGYSSCGPDQIKCLSGRCIPYMYRCDNEYDCKDHSDEWDCSDWCDPIREFKCANSSVCLPKVYQCDNEYNCLDKSDEMNCSAPVSHCDENTEFQCYSGSCIAKIWMCDGDKDCHDNSDEDHCPDSGTKKRKCHSSEFQCEDGKRCIPMSWKCDLDKDCNDTSDERDCRHQAPCEAPKFICPENNNTCLDVEKLCDNHWDCHNGTDEGRLCDYNMCINNDCSHHCHIAPDGFVCSCPDNMRLSSNGKTCVAVDVCEKWGICSQKCVNMPDGHQCLCHPGYMLANDRYSCKPNDSVPIYIIYSNRHEIRRYDLGTMNYFSLISGLRNTIALDFHYAHKWIFWTDVVDDKIYRGQMISNTITDIKPIIDVGLATTEGLAIDWIADNIYWVESNLDQIEVAKLDGTNRSTLVAGDMISPRAIVLDPRDGVLFWTDWDGQKPRIEGCSMSGEDRKVIYDITKVPGGGWPNGLTLDYEARRLYWVDARSDSVHTITYEGKDHHLIVHNHDALAHPFALTTFEHYVYWTDWRTNSLVRANKFNGSDVLTIQRTFTQPFDLQVFHPKRQPHAPNPCQDNNGGCSHLCLIGSKHEPICKCPHRMKLNHDNVSCTQDNKFLLFVKENEIRGVDLVNAHFNVIPSITVPFVENATAIDYDSKEDKLYWTDKKRNVIRSAFINGTGVETVIDSGISNPEGFAIDWLSRNMYFSSYDDQKASISVAKLNGAFRTEIVSTSPIAKLSKPNSIAVHPREGLMFWSDLGGDKHRIIKANMDGSQPIVIVADAKHPASLTIDVTSNKLYWISRELHTLKVCNLDGSDIKDFATNDSSIVSPMSMTIYENMVYVANTAKILKFKADMTTKPEIMRDNTPHVYAMQVYDPNIRANGSNGCSKEKNGGCEQMCLPTGNKSRICKCTAGFTPKDNECHGIDSFLLYSTESEIRGFSLNDTQSEALAPISKISLAASVDFHAGMDSIFWVDSNSRSISRIKRDLTMRETLVEDRINGIEGIAVDWIAGNIYWTDRGHDTIEVSDLNGKNRYVVMHGDMEKPKAIAVHPVEGYVFFSDWGSKPKIVRARLDGSEREDWINTTIKLPYGLTIDYTSNSLYWCDKGLDTIEKVGIRDRSRTIIHTNSTDCVSLAVFNEYIYWADITDGAGSIKQALKKDGSNVRVLKKNIKKLKDIKVFDPHRQIGSNICQGNQYKCEELCLFKGNKTASCACSYGKLSSDLKNCEEHNDFLMFSEVTSLHSIHLTAVPNPNDPKEPISNSTYMKNVIGLAFDHASQRIFYSDIQIGNIQSVTYNGKYIEEIVNGVGAAEGLAYDSTRNELIWTSYTNSSISKINLSAKPKERTTKVLIQLTGEDHPRAIVIDVCSNKMFWTNWNDQRPSIQTSSLEGYKIQAIITKNIRTPNGLAIDHKGQRLYWTDARLDKIERCHFDGSHRVVIVTKLPQHSFGIAVYEEHIYWTDWMLRAVLRASKYDGSGLTWLKKGIKRQPMGIIAVTNETNDCTTNPCHGDNDACDELCYVTAEGGVACACAPGHKLLPDGWRCADESLNCSMHDFVCDDKKRCVPITKTCNSINDCLDASDESTTLCGGTRQCPSGYFTCGKNGRCITLDKICDGKTDCGGEDETDEEKCPCKDDQFRCNVGLCINQKYRCDRDSDCPDHSDEIGCNLTCSELEIDGEFLEGLVSCNTTSACIYPSWKCDGSNDCWDNSDEEKCQDTGSNTCADKAFTCKSGSCIPPQWHCDKDNDCGDNSDEDNCTYSCDKNQFKCDDTNCIPSTWQCDGHPDCADSSDESDECMNRTCTEDKFRCATGRCIPATWKCDRDNDCDNGADETAPDANCPEAPRCDAGEFTCNNRRCIRNAFYCDKDDDCGDGSDEPEHCVFQECAHNEFRCANKGQCIPLKDHCNGLFDCRDHSDEKECDVSPCGNVTQFQCKNHVCINDDLVCNGHNDCGDMSDEPAQCGVNECLAYQHNLTHMCTQKCRDKKIGFECDCRNGFKLLSDNRTCIDVDECNTTYPCSHYCVNTVGSYICGCPDHYRLQPDRHRCKVKGAPPNLLVSNRYYIREVEFPRGNMTILTDKLFNSVAIDYDWKEQYIYWSDITSVNSSINRMSIAKDNTSKKTEVLHSTTVRNPDGLAVDWIGRNLYWCDKTTDTIEVSRLSGTFRKVLLREGLQEPRGLEVFPARGYLFFTDWGDSPHISRMWMDGTNRQTVIKDNLAWPNALTIDYVTEKIFWADGSLDYIAMANLDGSGRKVVVSDKMFVPHVFALATFESYIIWSDWEKTGVFYADKFSGKNVTMLARMVHRPMDIQVLHEYRQIPGPDDSEHSPCHNNGGCSHLCLLRPTLHNKHSNIEAICACPENHYLGTDKKSCISNCTNAQFLCEASSKCIPKWWHCDNHTDCEDMSDEPANCTHYYCDQPGLFQCKNATSNADCFVPTVICDGTSQCSDGSDEQDCESYPCMEHQFKCRKNNTCISKTMQCNGQHDCSDGEDENNCPKSNCSANQFTCNNGRCVPYVWRCDHDNDCGDSSDEPANCTTLACKGDHIKCNISGRCIPNAWKCDGDPDCGENDDTDEKYEECHARTCDPTYFKCDNGHCIPGRWKCDYYDDCRDGSDEKKCTPRNCSEAEIKCGNGKCIRKNLRCDGEVHCEDGSDEKNCTSKTCDDKTEFKCEKVVHCIPKSWHCDGDTDCADGTDELSCDRNCTRGEFRCNNSLCMPLQWQCDGDQDCGDGSDETPEACAKFDCAPGRFRCGNNICIWGSNVCDGNPDCNDETDEKNCPGKCREMEFECWKSHQCISHNLVCDGTPHCEDKTDEDKAYCKTVKPLLNCSIENGGCEQRCKQLKAGVKCLCKDGYEISDDGFQCDHSNPCDKWGVCSQKCNFTKTLSHHYCYCQNGFRRQFGFDGSCVAVGTTPSLLIAERTKVLQSPTHVAVTNDSFAKPLNVTWVSHGNNSTIIAMDVDTTGQDYIAFVVTESDSMWMVNKHTLKNAGSKRVTRDVKSNNALWFGHAKIADISLDWISGRIYYIDATTKSIQLRSYNGSNQVHLIDSGLDQPCSIAVDPHSGKIFWTEQGVRPKIASAYLDGSKRTTLVREELEWPNGIAVDHQNGWVYWCDTKKSTVETVNVNGKGRIIVHRFDETDPPYKIEVFEDFLYVLTYRKNQLLKLHKFGRLTNRNPSEIQPVFSGLEQVNAIVIIQEHKMDKTLTNNCTSKSCPSGMCFNNQDEADGFSCKCPRHSKMKNEKCDFKNPCESYCQNGGNCSITVHRAPKCSCPFGFNGDRCEHDQCQNYCLNGGKCSKPTTFSGQSTCRCPSGYKGPRCEKYICTDYCRNDGLCYVADNKPNCKCDVKHTGPKCEQVKQLNCSEFCTPNNHESCSLDKNNKSVTCTCKQEFTGDHCEQCRELHCYNNGRCIKQKGEYVCECQENYNATLQCSEPICDYKCKHNLQNLHKDGCKCNGKCPGPDCGADKEVLCSNYCQNKGECIIKSGQRECKCSSIHFGTQCQRCKCHPGGECIQAADGHFTCSCSKGFTGPLCEIPPPKPVQSSRTPLNPLYIIVPAVALVVIMLLILAIVFYRRRQRLEQYGHKRMKEPNRMDVKNPMYLRHEEEPGEMDPLGSNPIFRGDASTNFANPMYDVYNTSESMQMLLNQDLPQDCEENQLLEEGSNVRYFGTSDKPLKLPKA